LTCVTFYILPLAVALPINHARSNKADTAGGGYTSVEGSRSSAVGGDAGESAESGRCLGGSRGNAVVKGDDSRARGGNGGNCGQADGRGGRRTKSPGELENLPTAMWPYGYGGNGANAPEYDRRLDILTQIRTEYAQAFPTDKPFVDAGVDPVPLDWVNKKA